jgi:hypothetical protein
MHFAKPVLTESSQQHIRCLVLCRGVVHHAGRNRWTDHFNHVVGIMHTNYVQYVSEEAGMRRRLSHVVGNMCSAS